MNAPSDRPITLFELIGAVETTVHTPILNASQRWDRFADLLKSLLNTNPAQATHAVVTSGEGPAPETASVPTPPDAATTSSDPGSVAGSFFADFPLPWRFEPDEVSTNLYPLDANGQRVGATALLYGISEIAACINACGGRPERVQELLEANSKLTEALRGEKIAYANAMARVDAMTSVITMYRNHQLETEGQLAALKQTIRIMSTSLSTSQISIPAIAKAAE